MPDIDPMLEKHEPGAEVDIENDVVMQSYPSPTVEGQDSGPFYHTTPRQEHHQPQTDLNAQQDDGGQLAEPPTPRQGGRGAISSAEELQLAAQLSQGLTHGLPMGDLNDDSSLQHVMAHGLEQHEEHLEHHEEQMNHDHDQFHHDAQQQQQHQQQHDEIPPQHDGLPPSNEHSHEHMQEQMHEQMHDHIPDHAHEHEPTMNAQHEQHLQHDQHHQHHQHHQAQQQQQSEMQHQYLSDQQHHQHPQQQHLQPAAPMDPMASPFQMPDNNVPPRKRSKVSRACDECRRKKVKCDAPSETGEEPCSNCRRSNMRCLFSRIPQKRGPSKGYIKELADRIHSIEGKLASEGTNADLNELLNGSRRDSSDLFVSADANRSKRPYSSISGGDYDTPTSTGQFGSEPRQIQPYQTTPSDRYRPPYSVNGLAPAPITPKHDGDPTSRPVAAMDDSMGLDLNHMDSVQEIDETTFAAYLTLVHPVFPVLAANKSRLEQQLAQCPPTLRDAFTTALNGTIESFPSFNVDGGFRQNLMDALRLLMEWKLNVSTISDVARLVHLQTLILIAIASDHCGPHSLKGEQGSPNKAMILGEAVGAAYSMRLHESQANADLEGDSDADQNVAIRAWWSLIMLDRWNAISTASPVHVTNDNVIILPGLKVLLGENVYHLARLTNILGHFVPVRLLLPKTMVIESGAALEIGSFMNLSIELFREVLPSTITPSTHPIIHLVYWQTRLLANLFQPNATPSNVMWPCKELVGLLVGNPQMLNPLNHHFFCLTTLALLELAKVDSERETSKALLKELLESQVAPSNWDNTIRDRIAEHLRPSTAQATMETTASQSLQHLADLATATEVNTKLDKADNDPRANETVETVGFDVKELVRTGYLSALSTAPADSAR